MERTVALPVGEVSGRLGSMAKTDLMAGMTALRGVLINMGLVTEAEYSRVIEQVQQELSSGAITWPFFIAYGQKPG